nr:uncharacterized protein LOC116433657 isoform X2 [Nomia melanderi]
MTNVTTCRLLCETTVITRIKIFWKVLNVLSYHAVKERQIEFDFQDYDTVLATKLCFAYLQYPAVKFYACNENDKNSRQLLLAFAWLLGSQDALRIVVRTIVANSVFGRECSYLNNFKRKEAAYNVPETQIDQINDIIHLNGKVNYNIREISNLVKERANLISRVHAVTTNVSGLPHLSVSELALIKRIATSKRSVPSEEDQKYLKELFTIGNLLDVHVKWLRKECIFFKWMVTVVEEHHKSLSSGLHDINWDEIFKFISTLHDIMQEKLKVLSSKKNSDCQDYKFKYASRLLIAQNDREGMENLFSEISTELNKETESLSEKKEKLSKELKKLLQLIPSCIQL